MFSAKNGHVESIKDLLHQDVEKAGGVGCCTLCCVDTSFGKHCEMLELCCRDPGLPEQPWPGPWRATSQVPTSRSADARVPASA